MQDEKSVKVNCAYNCQRTEKAHKFFGIEFYQ